MGLSGSKIGKQLSLEDVQEGSLPSTPILTPRIPLKNDLVDPRSPSTSIARTPLELYDKDISGLNETPLQNYECILGVDPRSPTTDFVRTPIVINSCDNEYPEKIKNKNLEKVLFSEIYSPKNKKNTPSNIIPPKLLESSPIKSRTDVYKRKSFVGLLETNLDFTETDLDVVIREKIKAKDIPSPNRINIVEAENVDPRSPTTDFLRTPIQIVKKIGEIELNNPEEESVVNCNDDTSTKQNEETQKIEVLQVSDDVETENVVTEDVCTEEQVNTSNSSNDELSNVETPVSIQSAPVTPPNVANHNVVLPETGSKSVPATPPLINLTADVRELDKKLTDLIYEDRDIVVCPRIVKLRDVTERSPLKNRNVIDCETKTVQKLKVSDKPRKSDFAVSKIPIYRQKTKDSMKNGNVQCENTPPRSIKKRLPRKSRWDNADTTLYL